MILIAKVVSYWCNFLSINWAKTSSLGLEKDKPFFKFYFQLKLDIKKYNEQYVPMAIKAFENSHDRF